MKIRIGYEKVGNGSQRFGAWLYHSLLNAFY